MMKLSGEKAWAYVVEYWPMDAYATTFFLVAAVAGFVWWKVRKNKVWREKTVTWFVASVDGTWNGLSFMVRSPWLMMRGLFFEPNGTEGKYKFDTFKFFFVLASFVMLFRLGTGGRTFEDLRIGPDVEDKFASAANKVVAKVKRRKKGKRSKRNKAATPTATPPKRYRPWMYVKKSNAEPLILVELFLFLGFLFGYYFSDAIQKGDSGGTFKEFVRAFGFGMARKFGGGGSDPPPPPGGEEDDTDGDLPPPPTKDDGVEAADKKEEGGGRRRGGGEKKEVMSLEDDPFANKA